MFWLRTCLPYMAAAVTDSNLHRLYRCRCRSLPRRSASSGAIKPLWRKKKLFCQTDWRYECRNSGGVHLFLKIWFWISDFAVWEEKEGDIRCVWHRGRWVWSLFRLLVDFVDKFASSFVEITKRCGLLCQQLKRCHFLHRFFCRFVL